MAIDTEDKRRSAGTHPVATTYPKPNSGVDLYDRGQVAWLYYGLLPVTVSAPINLFRTAIELRNTRGRLIRIFNKELMAASWTFDRTGGCGTFRVSLKSKYDDHPIAAWGDHDVRIYLGPTDGTTQTLWFRGYVDRTTGKLSPQEQVELTGFGYVRQLERIVLNNKNYLNKEVSAIITDILDNYILPNTDITYQASDIEATSVTAQSIIFNTSADQAIKTLAELVGSREWGVDKNLKFYFKQRHEYGKIFLFIKKDVDSFEDTRSFDEIKNSLYLQGKDGFTYALQEQESINLYGKRQEIIVNSSITNNTDADQYLESLMDESARPRRQLSVRAVNVNSPFENTIPLGKVVFMGEDLQGSLYGEKKYGEFLYGYPYQAQVNTINYNLRTPGSGIAGVDATIRAAYLPPQIGKTIKQLERELEELREA